jgi:ProP effector
MEQLIAKLEAKIDWLTEQLESAKKEISQLKEADINPIDIDYSASMDLLQHMTDRPAEDKVQLYIKDSLGLTAENISTKEQTIKTNPVEYQLNFDLLHEHADTSSTTTTTTEQIDDMTTQQPEINGLQNDELVDTNTSTSETSNSTTETATLTSEQKKRQKNQKNNRRLIKMLEDRYPKAFDWNQPKPLKVGIDKDMTLDDDFNASKQKRALAAYTRSDRYKKCLLSGQPRIDLEGIAVNDEPALPDSMIPAKAKIQKTRTTSRPTKDTTNQPTRNKSKNAQTKTNQSKKAQPAKQSRQEDIYDNLSPEERMKAKLEKLLNKS